MKVGCRSLQDYGFDGSFEEWYWEAYGEESPTAAVRRLAEPQEEVEQVNSGYTFQGFKD